LFKIINQDNEVKIKQLQTGRGGNAGQSADGFGFYVVL